MLRLLLLLLASSAARSSAEATPCHTCGFACDADCNCAMCLEGRAWAGCQTSEQCLGGCATAADAPNASWTTTWCGKPSGVAPATSLRTEHQPANEVVLTAPTVGTRFTWQQAALTESSAAKRGAVQSSFFVQVLGPCNSRQCAVAYSSGMRSGAAQHFEMPEGVELDAGADYRWRVQTTVGGKLTGFSPSLPFTTAPASWGGAQWIGGKNSLRTNFSLPSQPTRARAYVSGLGAFYLYVNGQRVGDHVLDPPQTVYPKRVDYMAFDVLSMLAPGENVVGALLGNYKWGYTDVWCNMTAAGGPDGCRAFLFKLEVTLADGSVFEHTSGTGSDWSCRQSPIIWDHLFHGETYDARLEVEDWASPKGVMKAADGWSPTHLMHHIPGPTQEGNINTTGPLFPAMLPPIRVTETFHTVAVRKATLPSPGGAPSATNCAAAGGGGTLAFMATECEQAHSDPNCGPPKNDPPCCGAGTAGTLKCKAGGTIKNVTFAVWGSVIGDCASGFHAGSCHADLAETLARVKAACVGRSECSINATSTFDTNRTDPCPSKIKSLAVEATGCEAEQPAPPPAPPSNAPAPRWVFDFGQNVNGFVTLSLAAGHSLPAGTHIRLEHGEITHEMSQGGDTYDTYCRVNPKALDLRHEPCQHQTYGGSGAPGDDRSKWGHNIAYEYIGDFNNANQTNIYIVKDSGAIEYSPFFSTAGFRFVTISGLPASFKPPLSMLTSHFTHTDVAPYGDLKLAAVAAEGNGTLATADVLNRIHHLVRYSQMANLMGDAQVTSHEAMLSFDMQTFYEKFFDDIRDDQLWGCSSRHSDGGSTCGGQNATEAQGSVADVTPYDGIGGWPGCPVWQVAYIVIARNHWRHYGDVAPLKKHYPGLVDLMQYFLRRADKKTGLLLDGGYGDWVCVGSGGGCPRTPADSVSAFYFVQALGFLGEIATVIGREEEATNWGKMHTAGVSAWHKRYFNATLGTYSPCKAEPLGSQTSNSMALALSAPPDAATRAKVVSRLVENVAANDGRFTFGIVGSAWLFPMLEESGHGDIALDILLTDTYPSFGHFLVENMTTLCENWKCSFHNPGGGSQNHIMYGAFDAWLVTAVGGMSTVSNTTSTAWQHIIVHTEPAAVTKLTSGSYSINTRFGPTAVCWSFKNSKLQTNITIPVGSTAEVVHDAQLRNGACELTAVLESGEVVWSNDKSATAATTQQHSTAGVGAVALKEAGDGGVRRRTATTVGSGSYSFEARYECA